MPRDTILRPPGGTVLCLAVVLPLAGAPAAAAQTGEAVPLTGTIDMYPHASPDGSRVVFQSSRGGAWDLFVLDLGSGEVERLTSTPDIQEVTPVWSPDGASVTYASDEGGGFDVWVMGADGSGRRVVTGYPGSEYHPRWSPDGGRIIFGGPATAPDPPAVDGTTVPDVFSVRADGSDLRRHTRCPGGCTFPSYSPDGTRIAYRKTVSRPGLAWDLSVSETDSEVFVADVDGSGERSVSASTAFDGWPVWSPAGDAIVFASNRTGPARTGQIWVVRADGTRLRRITGGPWSHAQPTWAPDGGSVFVYQLREQGSWEAGHVARVPVPPAGRGDLRAPGAASGR